MQQRQLRLGDILDDYCPRELRLTNHAVVAMVGADVKQTRCTTCETEHEFKNAKVPRHRKKSDAPPALYAQVLANGPNGPKKVPHDPIGQSEGDASPDPAQHDEHADENVNEPVAAASAPPAAQASDPAPAVVDAQSSNEERDRDDADEGPAEDGPVHRRLIRAQLPRTEGQPPAARPAPDFTIRQPGGRPNRFRPRHPRAGGPFPGNRTNGNFGSGGPMRGGAPRPAGGRPPVMSRNAKRQGPGRKRSK
jgi:hypothetical protein